MKTICETSGCEEIAEVIDDMDNKICSYCMEREIEEEGKVAEDYETIN